MVLNVPIKKPRIYAAPAVKGLKGLAHHLVLIIIVKNSKLAWCIKSWVIDFVLLKYHQTNLFQS